VTGVDGSGNGYQYGGMQSDTMASPAGHTVFSGGRVGRRMERFAANDDASTLAA
jgi:hypothetical protein